MKRVILACCSIVMCFGAISVQVQAEQYVPDLAGNYAEEQFEKGVEAMDQCRWQEAADYFHNVYSQFLDVEIGQDAMFFFGVCHYNLHEYDFANEIFTRYLKDSHPRYFENAIQYKFCIATAYKNGARRRLFGCGYLPKWGSGRDEAITLYNEVIAALPCHNLAAWSLYLKAEMYRQDCLFDDSVETYHQVIRRFPKHELAPQSYLAISYVFLKESYYEEQNPDIMALAVINFRRFQMEFPRDEERLALAADNVMAMRETYATSLYETGFYYERKTQPGASVIYYQTAIQQFPDTDIAQLCQERLYALTGQILLPECLAKEDEMEQEEVEQQAEAT